MNHSWRKIGETPLVASPKWTQWYCDQCNNTATTLTSYEPDNILTAPNPKNCPNYVDCDEQILLNIIES